MNAAERQVLERLIVKLESKSSLHNVVVPDVFGRGKESRLYVLGAKDQALAIAKTLRDLITLPMNVCKVCEGECGEWVDGCTCGAFVLCKACGGDGEHKQPIGT